MRTTSKNDWDRTTKPLRRQEPWDRPTSHEPVDCTVWPSHLTASCNWDQHVQKLACNFETNNLTTEKLIDPPDEQANINHQCHIWHISKRRSRIREGSKYHSGQLHCFQQLHLLEFPTPEPAQRRWKLKDHMQVCIKRSILDLATAGKPVHIRLQNDVCCTFPRGFNFRNSGVVFVTPIWNDGVSSIFTPTYSAAISALNTFFLLLPTGEWIIWNHQQPPPPKSG